MKHFVTKALIVITAPVFFIGFVWGIAGIWYNSGKITANKIGAEV